MLARLNITSKRYFGRWELSASWIRLGHSEEGKESKRYRPLWDVTIAVQPRCPVWCRLVTVPTDPFTTFISSTSPFLSGWAKCQPGNTQNGGSVFPIANLMADSKSGSPVSDSSFLATIWLSLLVSEICVQTDNVNHYYSWPQHCGGAS